MPPALALVIFSRARDVKKVDRQEPVAPPFVVFADAGPT
jgi:hypothetical protein